MHGEKFSVECAVVKRVLDYEIVLWNGCIMIRILGVACFVIYGRCLKLFGIINDNLSIKEIDTWS